MERELFILALFLLAAVSGAARFRSQKIWDDISLWVSLGANFAGTLLLASSLFYDERPAALVPLSLLILLHGTALVYKNHSVQILGLPLVICEIFLSLLFTSVRDLFASPVFLILAFMLHTGFLAAFFQLILHLPRVEMKKGSSWNPYQMAQKLDRHLRSRPQPG